MKIKINNTWISKREFINITRDLIGSLPYDNGRLSTLHYLISGKLYYLENTHEQEEANKTAKHINQIILNELVL